MGKIRFSEYFKLNKSQAELDFVDIYIDDDIPLYIDPYVFKYRNDKWAIDCNNLIVDFFEVVLNAIKSGMHIRAQELLENLSEPKETHFGVGNNNVSGRGIGKKQALDLYKAFNESDALKRGNISDISECELMIPNIGFDKISDITTNIIRSKLIEYTQEQCNLYGIETREIPSGKLWNPVDKRWDNGKYVELPVIDHQRILLVPKHVVVRKPMLYSRDFYNMEILEYIQAEHIRAMSSLVEVLKNGKARVTKKTLKEISEYKLSKSFIQAFCANHPEILESYKTRKGKDACKVVNINDDDIDEYAIASVLIEELKLIKPGSESASEYHDIITGILEFIFHPNLLYPRKEHEIHEGRKRIDITFSNSASSGFWFKMMNTPTVAASMIVIECKNYSRDIKNPELDQISGRFSTQRGWFGMILSRTFDDKELFIERCKDTAKDGRGIIICVDDDDIIKFLSLIREGRRTEIERILFDKYNEVIS